MLPDKLDLVRISATLFEVALTIPNACTKLGRGMKYIDRRQRNFVIRKSHKKDSGLLVGGKGSRRNITANWESKTLLFVETIIGVLFELMNTTQNKRTSGFPHKLLSRLNDDEVTETNLSGL